MHNLLTSFAASGLERFEAGLVEPGTSTFQDLYHGGGGYVFLRMVTRSMIDASKPSTRAEMEEGFGPQRAMYPVEAYPLSGSFQLLYGLDALSSSSYAYPGDRYGSKAEHHYGSRDSLTSFSRKLMPGAQPIPVCNEVMIPDFLDARHVQRILVQSPWHKEWLLDEFEKEGLMTIQDGVRYLKGVPHRSAEDLIVVGKAFRSEFWE